MSYEFITVIVICITIREDQIHERCFDSYASTLHFRGG